MVGKVDGEALPFQEAIDFHAQKVRLPSAAWTDLREGAHARGFVVAGATKDALLEDFHASVQKAIAEGRTLADFRKDFDKIVAAHGWDYKGTRRWRSAVIYNTNMRMAFSAGKWQQIQRTKERYPWLRYSAVMDGDTRPQHRAWHGTVLSADDPFWSTRYPPNGWGCRCTVEQLSDRDLERDGLTPSEAPPADMEQRTVRLANGGTETWSTPAGVDTGFGYNVGESWLGGSVPAQLQQPLPLPPPGPASNPIALPPLPKSRSANPALILPKGLAETEYVDRFLGEFGAARGKPAYHRDPSGGIIGISEELFRARDGRLKATKFGREQYLLLLADALKDPDEIWLDWVDTKVGAVLRRRYLQATDIPGHAGSLLVFEWSALGWSGVTAFPPEKDSNFTKQRAGVLLWRKKGSG